MSSSRRTLNLVIGIFIGIALSFLAFYFMSNKGQKSSDKVASNEKIVSQDVQNVIPTDNSKIENSYTVSDIKKSTVTNNDTTVDFFPNVDQNSKLYDSLMLVMNNGNNFTDNNVITENENHSNDNVKQEQLLKVGSAPLINKNSTTIPDKNDSLLNKNNGIKLEKNPSKYEIEFWQSPLNAKGYRVGKNKLALYGVDPESKLIVYQLDQILYLKTEKELYRLEKSSQFRNFVKENDQEIIKQLLN